MIKVIISVVIPETVDFRLIQKSAEKYGLQLTSTTREPVLVTIVKDAK